MKGANEFENICQRLAGYTEGKISNVANAYNLSEGRIAQRVAELLRSEGDSVSSLSENSSPRTQVVGSTVEVGRHTPNKRTRSAYKRRAETHVKVKKFTMTPAQKKRISLARKAWWASRTPEQRKAQIAATTRGARKARGL